LGYNIRTYLQEHRQTCERHGTKLVMAIFGPQFEAALKDTVEHMARNAGDALDLVPTKKWGKAWKIDGTIVVMDPRVEKVFLRADCIKEQKNGVGKSN
jgi:hypothetical protein